MIHRGVSSYFSALKWLAAGAAFTGAVAWSTPVLAEAVDAAAIAPEWPNILFILADDLRYDMLGVAGNDDIHTPVLDALAGRGIYFTQATVHAPQCCAARAVVISGLTPFQSGYLSMEVQEPGAGEPDSFERFPTLPSILRDNGYQTVLVGKWHIKPDPWRSGFTETRYWFAGGMCGYADPLLSRGESREAEVVPGNITEIFADDAIDFLKSPRATEKPFFLWVAPTAPHEPCGPTPGRINDLYQGVTSEDIVRDGIELGNSPRWDHMWVPYFQAVTHMDEQIGRMLDALDTTGFAASTIVIFVSDSGIMMGRRGIGSKVAPFEDSIRIPLIVHAPWLQPRVSEAPVSDLDLPPTILHMTSAGSSVPDNWVGRDLTPILRDGDAAAGPEFAYAISLWAENVSHHWAKWSNRTIRTARHKVIVWQDDKPAEFYHIASDPHEDHNLADSPEHRETMNELRNKVVEWMRASNDPALDWPKKWKD